LVKSVALPVWMRVFVGEVVLNNLSLCHSYTEAMRRIPRAFSFLVFGYTGVMYVHPKLTAFVTALENLLNEVDDEMEDKYADIFPLHPNRPERGTTASSDMDGLFEIAPDFTPGIGSAQGKGYLVSCRVATLANVPDGWFEAFLDETAERVREKLPVYFPDRELSVVRDGSRYKIIGDFSLGEA
jgi:hypothetical protein